MKKILLKQRKAEKRSKQIKDYKKKRNIIANRPTKKQIIQKPVFTREIDRKGNVTVVQVGTKDIVYKIQTKPGVKFPKSKKFKVIKKKKKNVKKEVKKRKVI